MTKKTTAAQVSVEIHAKIATAMNAQPAIAVIPATKDAAAPVANSRNAQLTIAATDCAIIRAQRLRVGVLAEDPATSLFGEKKIEMYSCQEEVIKNRLIPQIL